MSGDVLEGDVFRESVNAPPLDLVFADDVAHCLGDFVATAVTHGEIDVKPVSIGRFGCHTRECVGELLRNSCHIADVVDLPVGDFGEVGRKVGNDLGEVGDLLRVSIRHIVR